MASKLLKENFYNLKCNKFSKGSTTSIILEFLFISLLSLFSFKSPSIYYYKFSIS